MAHHLVHDPHHAAADRPRVRLRPARRPHRAGPVVLPAGVLRAVRDAVGSRRTDLDLDLHARLSACWTAALGTIGITAPNWLGDPNWAMPSLAITTVWWTLGFNFVLYLAGLQDIPPRALRGGRRSTAPARGSRSGASRIPLLGRTTTLVVVLQVIASLKVFDQMYIMTARRPELRDPARSLRVRLRRRASPNYRVGYASAVSMLFFVVVLAVSAVWFCAGPHARRRRADMAAPRP